MSSIEQTNIPNPLVGPIVAPPVPDADQAPAAPVGLHAQHGDNIHNGVLAEDEAKLVSGTILPVSEAPIDENQAHGTVIASDGVHYSGAKAKAIIEASKAQSAQAKKTKAAAVNKLQNHQATNTPKVAGASKTSSCPSGEAQLNMIFSHLNGLAVKVDKIAKAQDKLLSHAEFTRDKVEEMVPHILEEEDDDYTEDEESDDDDENDSDDSEEDDEEEDDENNDEEEEAQAAPVIAKSGKRKGKGPAAQTAKKHKRVVIDDEISDREEEDSEIAVKPIALKKKPRKVVTENRVRYNVDDDESE